MKCRRDHTSEPVPCAHTLRVVPCWSVWPAERAEVMLRDFPAVSQRPPWPPACSHLHLLLPGTSPATLWGCPVTLGRGHVVRAVTSCHRPWLCAISEVGPGSWALSSLRVTTASREPDPPDRTTPRLPLIMWDSKDLWYELLRLGEFVTRQQITGTWS